MYHHVSISRYKTFFGIGNHSTSKRQIFIKPFHNAWNFTFLSFCIQLNAIALCTVFVLFFVWSMVYEFKMTKSNRQDVFIASPLTFTIIIVWIFSFSAVGTCNFDMKSISFVFPQPVSPIIMTGISTLHVYNK